MPYPNLAHSNLRDGIFRVDNMWMPIELLEFSQINTIIHHMWPPIISVHQRLANSNLKDIKRLALITHWTFGILTPASQSLDNSKVEESSKMWFLEWWREDNFFFYKSKHCKTDTERIKLHYCRFLGYRGKKFEKKTNYYWLYHQMELECQNCVQLNPNPCLPNAQSPYQYRA